MACFKWSQPTACKTRHGSDLGIALEGYAVEIKVTSILEAPEERNQSSRYGESFRLLLQRRSILPALFITLYNAAREWKTVLLAPVCDEFGIRERTIRLVEQLHTKRVSLHCPHSATWPAIADIGVHRH